MFMLRRLQNPNLKFLRRFSVEIEKLKGVGFNELESKRILEEIEGELDDLIKEFGKLESFKGFQRDFEDKMISASSFVTSNNPFQMKYQNQSISNNNNNNNNNQILIPYSPVIDPVALEKEIKSTGQQLKDELEQLRADEQLETNLEGKRREEIEMELQSKLENLTKYSEDRIKNLNGHLDKVSKQAITSIGGFIAVLTTVFISYSILSS